MAEKVVLDKAAILAAGDRRIEPVDVPEWGGTVFVRSLSGAERDGLEELMVEISNSDMTRGALKKHVRARLVVLAACDANGKRIFEDGDLEAVNQKDAQALRRVFLAAQRVSGMGRFDVEEKVAELKKDRSAVSTSG